MLPVLHARRIMIRTALWWTRPRDGHGRDMLSSLLLFSRLVLPLSLLNIISSSWLYRQPVGFDGLSILQGHFSCCDGCFTIFGYVALYSRLSTCLYHDNEDMVLFVKYRSFFLAYPNMDLNDLHPPDDYSHRFFIWHEWIQVSNL